MKKALLFIAIIALAACGQRSGSTGDNPSDIQKLKDINKKSCINAMMNSKMADSATAVEFCDCYINKMFEMYSYEEIMQWSELSRDERIARENRINADCQYILDTNDTIR